MLDRQLAHFTILSPSTGSLSSLNRDNDKEKKVQELHGDTGEAIVLVCLDQLGRASKKLAC